MLTAAVIHLQAVSDGKIEYATGRGVHGFWFHRWAQVAPSIADDLHQENQIPPYTLSPIMELPRPSRNGSVNIAQGSKTWVRVTALTRSLSEVLLKKWLPGLENDTEIEIPQSKIPKQTGFRWRVTGVSLTGAEHPWAGQISYSQLTSKHLYAMRPPNSWRMSFVTPTSFHGGAGHFPFPLPDSLVTSWLRRWQAFAPIALPDDLPDLVRQYIVISAYSLKTAPVHAGKRLTVGCVGQITLRALKMPPEGRAALDLLANYAFFVGSGHRTTQGMGLTRRVG